MEKFIEKVKETTTDSKESVVEKFEYLKVDPNWGIQEIIQEVQENIDALTAAHKSNQLTYFIQEKSKHIKNHLDGIVNQVFNHITPSFWRVINKEYGKMIQSIHQETY